MTLENGTITTMAGTGEAGYDGDGGAAAAARLSEPFMCAFDRQGNLYVAESANHCVRRIDGRSGIITTVAGTGELGYGGDGGPATKATLNQPYALDIAANGDLYIVDRLNAVVRKVDATSGTISTVAGTGTPGSSGDGGPAIEAALREPNDCFLDGNGGLLIADVQDHRVRRLDLATGVITTFAGNGDKARAGDGLPATEASIFGARAVCGDGRGNTYICEREGNGVRKVDADGFMSTFAGTGEGGYSGDGGPATAAGLDRPHGCCVDTQGNLYIADSNNHRVRIVRA